MVRFLFGFCFGSALNQNELIWLPFIVALWAAAEYVDWRIAQLDAEKRGEK